jgi:hypothetical protein
MSISIFDIETPTTMSCVPGRREVVQLTREEYHKCPRMLIHQAGVVIVDGRMVKNRDGRLGYNLGGSLFVWDERNEG